MRVLAAASNIGNERPAVRQGSLDGHPWPWLLINRLRRQMAHLHSFVVTGPERGDSHGRMRPLLTFDTALRTGVVLQRLTRFRPGGIAGIERGTQIGPGQPLDNGQAVRVLVVRFFCIIAGNPADPMLSPDQGQQALASRAAVVSVRMPGRTPDREKRRLVDMLIGGATLNARLIPVRFDVDTSGDQKN